MLRWLTALSPASHRDRAADFPSFPHSRRGPPSPQQPKKMGENTSFVAIKYIFFGFNVFVWLLGCGVLALGIWLQVNRGPFLSLVPSYTFLSASALCITAGAIILVIGFLGCCGAFLENQCMLVGYFVLVLLIFALQITAGTIGFIKKAEVKRLIKNELLVSIKKEYTLASHNQHRHGWVNIIDDVQRQLRCCGVNNHTDWFRVNAWPEEDRVPVSCCEQEVVDCETKGPWHGRGCLGEMEYWFIRNMYVLGVVGITVGVIQILGIIAAIIMFCYLRSRKFLL